MIPKQLIWVLSFLLVFNTPVFAQSGSSSGADDEIGSKVDYKVNKMQKVLNLTDSQVYAIRPIIKDYLLKREELLQQSSGGGIVDHVAVKSSLKELKDKEYQELGHILSAEQMEKWINKENLMATLNPDSSESSIDDEPSMGANGANFKF